MATRYDLAIIGGGPGGYVAAIRAAQLGLSVVLVEKDARLGGTCLLRGCIPTKSLLESATTVERVRRAKDFGVLAGEPRVDLPLVMKRKARVVASNAGGVSFLMKKNDVRVVRGHGRLVADSGGGQPVKGLAVSVSGEGGELRLEAHHVLLATGAVPRPLPFAEPDGRRILTSDDLLELEAVPSHLIVLGSGAVGLELASAYRSFGAQVTVIELLERLAPFEDEDVSEALARAWRRRKIKCLVGARCSAVEVDDEGVSVRARQGDEVLTVRGSHLLVAVGRAPVTAGLGLEGSRVVLGQTPADRGFVQTDDRYRTGEPGVYAIGDIVAGTPQLAHAASHEGIVAVEQMAGLEPPSIDYERCPGVIYCEPEIASVGLTERAARARHGDLKVGRFPFSAVGKAKVIGATEGFVKVIAEARYDQLVGVRIVGPHATELIAEAVSALRLESTLEELARTIHAHPTLSEALGEAAHAALGHALHQ